MSDDALCALKNCKGQPLPKVQQDFNNYLVDSFHANKIDINGTIAFCKMFNHPAINPYMRPPLAVYPESVSYKKFILRQFPAKLMRQKGLSYNAIRYSQWQSEVRDPFPESVEVMNSPLTYTPLMMRH